VILRTQLKATGEASSNSARELIKCQEKATSAENSYCQTEIELSEVCHQPVMIIITIISK